MKKKLLALIATGLSCSTAFSTNYSVKTVDYPGSEGATTIADISATGRIVGAQVAINTRDSFGFTEKSSVFTPVGATLPCRPTRCSTGASRVNILGQIAGSFVADVDFPGAFIQSGPSAAPHIIQPPAIRTQRLPSAI